ILPKVFALRRQAHLDGSAVAFPKNGCLNKIHVKSQSVVVQTGLVAGDRENSRPSPQKNRGDKTSFARAARTRRRHEGNASHRRTPAAPRQGERINVLELR